MKLIKLEEKEFNLFAEKHPLNTFHQNTYWGHLKENTGWKMHLVGFKEDNKIICETMLLSKKLFGSFKMFYSPRGYLIDFNNKELLTNFINELKKYLKEEKGIFLKIDPYVPYKERAKDGSLVINGFDNTKVFDDLISLGYKHNGFSLNARNLQPRWISVLPLEGLNENNLLNSFDTQRRGRINRILDVGFKVRELKKEELNEFKKITDETSKRRGFIDRPLSYYEHLFDNFVLNKKGQFNIVSLDTNYSINKYETEIKEINNLIQNNIDESKNHENKSKFEKQIKELNIKKDSLVKKLNEVRSYKEKYGDEIIMSAALFLTFGTEVVYLASGTYEEFMDLSPQYYMQYDMIKWAIKNNYKVYNFYGISGNFDKNSDRFGVFDFKKGFNADVVELIGEFDLIINPFIYNIYFIAFKTYRFIKKIFK